MNLRCDNGTYDAHNTVASDGNAVAGATMSRGQHFGGVCVQTAVVDVLHMSILVFKQKALSKWAQRLRSDAFSSKNTTQRRVKPIADLEVQFLTQT